MASAASYCFLSDVGPAHKQRAVVQAVDSWTEIHSRGMNTSR